jgi:hypothetical protein
MCVMLMIKSSHCPDGKVADVLAPTHACTQLRPTLRSTTGCTCRRDLQCFPSPYGRHVWLVVCRAAVSMSWVAQCPSHRAPSVGTQLPKCALMFNSSHCPDGKNANAPRLSLAQLRLTLRSTTVCTCRRGLNFSHRPDGNIADVLMPRLFLQTTLWSTTERACHSDLQRFPSPRWENY